MSSVMKVPSPEAVADLFRNLAPAHQVSVYEFARFLESQEAALEVADEVEEAKWDQQFSNPEKMARFALWAEASLQKGPVESMDFSKL